MEIIAEYSKKPSCCSLCKASTENTGVITILTSCGLFSTFTAIFGTITSLMRLKNETTNTNQKNHEQKTTQIS
jgi:hypothetical protein